MYVDPNVYNEENLKKDDREKIALVETVKEEILNSSNVEEFIESKNIVGSTTQELYRDALNEFIGFLQERVEYLKVDMIIEKIDNYPEEYLDNLVTTN